LDESKTERFAVVYMTAVGGIQVLGRWPFSKGNLAIGAPPFHKVAPAFVNIFPTAGAVFYFH